MDNFSTHGAYGVPTHGETHACWRRTVARGGTREKEECESIYEQGKGDDDYMKCYGNCEKGYSPVGGYCYRDCPAVGFKEY